VPLPQPAAALAKSSRGAKPLLPHRSPLPAFPPAAADSPTIQTRRQLGFDRFPATAAVRESLKVVPRRGELRFRVEEYSESLSAGWLYVILNRIFLLCLFVSGSVHSASVQRTLSVLL
jgi:hypothetical protein